MNALAGPSSSVPTSSTTPAPAPASAPTPVATPSFAPASDPNSPPNDHETREEKVDIPTPCKHDKAGCGMFFLFSRPRGPINLQPSLRPKISLAPIPHPSIHSFLNFCKQNRPSESTDAHLQGPVQDILRNV